MHCLFIYVEIYFIRFICWWELVWRFFETSLFFIIFILMYIFRLEDEPFDLCERGEQPFSKVSGFLSCTSFHQFLMWPFSMLWCGLNPKAMTSSIVFENSHIGNTRDWLEINGSMMDEDLWWWSYIDAYSSYWWWIMRS